MSIHSTLNCPQCQEPIPVTLKDFKIAGCANCGHVSVLNKDGQLKLTHHSPVVSPKEQDPFYIGRQLQYRKITYTVSSVFVYEVDFQEWDTEDSKWVKDKGYIREWYAYDDQQVQLLIIMKDTDGKFYAMPKPVPIEPNAGLSKKNAIELGQYRLWGFTGIENEALDLKGYYRIYGHTRLECANEQFEKDQILQYQLTRLAPTQVKRMVILEEAEKLKASEDFISTTYYRNLFGLALLAILALLIFNLGGNESQKNRGIRSSSADQYIRFGDNLSPGELDTIVYKPKSAGTFDLVACKNYRFAAQCYLREMNQYIDYSVSMVRKTDSAVVSDIALSFYTESGTDDEGYWEEVLLHDQFKFQVDKTGKYEVFVAPDFENLWGLPPASLEIQIERAPYTFFYIWTSAFFLLLFLIFQWRRENLVAFANLPHDTLLHDIYESFL